jgi:hypothetical protein
MGLTDDPSDPRLQRGVGGDGMNEAYLVLSEEERAKGLVRPLRRAYIHRRGVSACGVLTTMSLPLCETYARDPKFYGATYCCGCRTHLPVAEFDWDEDNQVVGS